MESFHRPSAEASLLFRQGKEIIEFYLKELEDEGIDHVPRWAPSSPPQAATRPTSLSTSPPALPKPASASTPSVCVSQPSEGKDGASQDSRTGHDGAAAPADSLAELSAATPEGAFGARQQGRRRLSRGCRSFSKTSLCRVEERCFCLQINWMQITSSVTSGT